MIRGLSWRCDVESQGFVVGKLRIVAYAPLLDNAQLLSLIKSNFNMNELNLMTDTLIGIRRCWVHEEEPVYRLGVNEWSYGLVLLVDYGLVRLEKRGNWIVLNRETGIDEELKILLERYSIRKCTSTYWKLNFILNSKDYGIWNYIKLYCKQPNRVTHEIIDPVLDELAGIIRELNVNLTYTEEFNLRSHTKSVLERLLYAVRIAGKYLERGILNEVRENILQYLKSRIHERELYTNSKRSKVQVELAMKGVLQAVFELFLRAKLGIPPVEDMRIWNYQLTLLQKRITSTYGHLKITMASMKDIDQLRHEFGTVYRQAPSRYYILPDGTRYPLPSEAKREAFLREYGYEIEAIEKLVEDSLKLVEGYKEATEYERELVLNDLRRRLRLAKERLRILADVAFNRGFLDLYYRFRREYERIDDIERSTQKELRRLEIEEDSLWY